MPKSLLARDLVKVAIDLATAVNHKPKQSHLRRATSTAYYALFHCLANNCADSIVGRGASYGRRAWRQSYRALQHGFAKSACDSNSGKMKPILERFPVEIQDFAYLFYNMQIKRHEADYDPYCRIYKSTVLTDIAAVKNAIAGFETSPLADRKAFAALVLFKQRIN